MPPAMIAGGISTVILLATYLATAAPDLTYWDASELITAAHTLGIPHPPGTPLWVLLGHISTKLFAAAGPVRSVTMLSVVAGALTGGVSAAMVTRWIGTRGAVAAAVMAGTMWSVWANATETEVYAVALLFSVILMAIGERAGRPGAADDVRQRWRALLVFIAVLSVSLHLSVLVALPAAIVLAWHGPRPTRGEILAWFGVAALAGSAFAILPLLSARSPMLDSGHPVTLQALADLVQRKQYAVAGLWPRTAPLWAQFGNMFEWADWQIAYGLHPLPAPSLARTGITLAWGWLAALGLRALWRHERRVGLAMLVMLVCGTFGVATWLNMHAGPSYAVEILPAGTIHEARERDYFFVLGFWAWGICAGAGVAAIARTLAKRLPPVVALLPLALTAVPLVFNRAVADRTVEPVATLPRTTARLLLDAVPPNGILYSAGDNDTFPLWYLQFVEQVRPDVVVITVPLLGAEWYRDQLMRRHHLLPESAVHRWAGMPQTLQATSGRALSERRPIRVSVLLSKIDRNRIDPTAGWALEGLVYAPSHELKPGEVGLVPATLVRAEGAVPPSSLKPLPVGSDPAATQMQALLRCPGVRALTDSLLVGTCNGG